MRKLHLLVVALTLGLAGCQPSGSYTFEPAETDPPDPRPTQPQALHEPSPPAGGGVSGGGGVVSDPADPWGY